MVIFKNICLLNLCIIIFVLFEIWLCVLHALHTWGFVDVQAVQKNLTAIVCNIKSPFCDPNMLFFWHNSVGKLEISLFPNFQSILIFCLWIMHVFTVSNLLHRPLCWNFHVDIKNAQIWWLFRQTSKFARNNFSTIIHDLKIPTFLEKNGGIIEVVDHEMDL